MVDLSANGDPGTHGVTSAESALYLVCLVIPYAECSLSVTGHLTRMLCAGNTGRAYRLCDQT